MPFQKNTRDGNSMRTRLEKKLSRVFLLLLNLRKLTSDLKVISGILLSLALGSSLAVAAVGDQVHQIGVPVSGVSTFCSIGLAFDGTALYYDRCGDSNIYKVNPITGALEGTFNTGISEFPNALAFDKTRNGLWIGSQSCNASGMPIYFWDFDDNSVSLAFTIPSTLINPATGQQFVSFCFTDGLAFNPNNPADPNDDELWFSDDVNGNIGVFRPNGTFVKGLNGATVDPSLGSTSGLAIGGANLYLANNGGGDVFRADISTNPLTRVDQFTSGDTRQEDMECDPITFAPTEVMWVRTTPQGGIFPDVITAYEIEPNTCGAGGAVSLHLGFPGGTANPSGSIAEPVNTATGNYFLQQMDVQIPGRGLSLTLMRTYNSLDTYSGPLGRGWTHSYNAFLTENPGGSVVIKQGDGRGEFYDPIGGGNYQARFAGVFSILIKNSDGTFTLTQKDQTQYQFSGTGKLNRLLDKNGNAIEFSYDTSGNLTTIVDTVGRSIVLVYDANRRIVRLSDPAGRALQYGYDVQGNLVSLINANGGLTTIIYDSSQRLTKVVRPEGNVLVENTYDGAGRVLSQANGQGFVTAFAYDSPRLGDTSVTDSRGGIIIHTHDAQLRLIKEVDPLGNQTNYNYDSNNNRSTITDKNGNTTFFSYDSRGNVTSKTDPLGNVTAIIYDALNNPTRRTDPLGNVTNYSYDAKGNLTQVTDPLGNISRISYDTFGQPITLTDARGSVTTNTFDAQGNLLRITDALGNQTSFAYDAVGRRIGVTNARGHTTSFAYDNNNNLLRVVDPLGNATAYTYDANNNRIRVTDPRGNATIFAYDANDLLSSVRDPLGNATTYVYDEVNNRTVLTDARGNTTRYTYDAANRLLSVADALGNPTGYAYDPNGNLLAQTNPLGHVTTFSYDALNRLLSTTDALGNTTQNVYDAVGRLIQGADANGRVTRYSYDALGRLVGVIDPAGGTASYAYDAVGNRTAITGPNGNTSTFVYDAVNRLISKTDPLGNVYSYVSDQVGNRVQLTDSKGNLIRYAYDPNNRLVEILYPDLSRVNFQYDPTGNRTQMIDALGTSNYQYDSLNRLTQYVDPFNKTVGYSYGPVGNRNALVYPDGKVVSYAYDALNRMQAVTDWLGGVTTYTYDAAGNLFDTVNPNGTIADYQYDNAERLVGLGNFKSDNFPLASYGLTLDPVGNRTSINKLEPLAPIFTPKNEGLSYDQDNRLLTINGSAVSHDPNGNLTNKQGTTYDYDFADRLVRVNGGINAYQYDGVGNRLVATRGGVTTRYTLDIAGPTSNVLVENDSAGNSIAYYVHGLGLISRITPSNDARYYHYDPIGSTVALTNSSESVTDTYSYDPFGKVMNSQESTNNPFQYVGTFGLMDEGSNVLYVRARYYDAAQGRFLTKDPLTGTGNDGQSLNRYAYALNRPVILSDISGLSAKEEAPSSSNLSRSECDKFKEIVASEAKVGKLETAREYAVTNVSSSPQTLMGIPNPSDVPTAEGRIDLDYFLDIVQFSFGASPISDPAYWAVKIGANVVKSYKWVTTGNPENLTFPYQEETERLAVRLARQGKGLKDLWPTWYLNANCP
ncbi:MAG: DUF6531 domain-containing protein [Deltaproteobacteria bacterium]|nr:DUF6531 domain-containing protein [Deltaproteobacteria bacterium]